MPKSSLFCILNSDYRFIEPALIKSILGLILMLSGCVSWRGRATNVVTTLPGGERLDTVRSSRPSYSITTRRTCPASGRTGRGRQMRQQLHREPRTGLARTPQTSLGCCSPVGGGVPRKPIMKCYLSPSSDKPRLFDLISLFSGGVLNSSQPLIRRWWPAPPQQKPQQLSVSNFSCFFCPPHFLSVFVQTLLCCCWWSWARGRGGIYGRDIAMCINRLLCHYLLHINISGSDLFADIGSPTTGNGAVHNV